MICHFARLAEACLPSGRSIKADILLFDFYITPVPFISFLKKPDSIEIILYCLRTPKKIHKTAVATNNKTINRASRRL